MPAWRPRPPPHYLTVALQRNGYGAAGLEESPVLNLPGRRALHRSRIVLALPPEQPLRLVRNVLACTKAKPLLPQLSRMSMSIFVPSMSFSDQKMVPQNYSTIVSAPCGCGAVAKNVLKCNGSTLRGASTHLRTSRAASLNVIVNGPLPAPPQAPTKPKKSAVITLI